MIYLFVVGDFIKLLLCPLFAGLTTVWVGKTILQSHHHHASWPPQCLTVGVQLHSIAIGQETGL